MIQPANDMNNAACPCCGYNTLQKRGTCEICVVCWWEDDGSDSISYEWQAYFLNPFDETRANPFDETPLSEKIALLGTDVNEVNLITARINFIQTGIYNPARTDLVEEQIPRDDFVQGRIFEWDSENRILSEPAVQWEITVKNEERDVI